MFIANCCYQGTVALFVALATIYILKYSKNLKSFIKNNIITAISYGIPALINYLIVKFIFVNNRISGGFDLALSIQKIIDGSNNMLRTYSILPEKLFVSAIVIILVVLLYYILKKQNPIKQKIISIFSVIYIVIITFFATILPQFMQATASIWFVPRSSYAFAGIIGILVLYLFMNYKVSIKLKKVMIVGIILYLCIQYISFQKIIVDHYIVNYLDEQQALQIKEKIQEYEEETNKTVTKVSFYQSKNLAWTYPGITAIGDINIKALNPDWSRIPYLKYYLNRNFEQVENDEKIYKEYFENKNWNHYEDEQIVIKDDTLHLCIY